MANRNHDSIARTRREEARVEAQAAMTEGRKMYRYGCAVARKFGHTDLLSAKEEPLRL